MCSKIHEGRSDFMSYYNKRNQEPLPKEDVSTWECTKKTVMAGPEKLRQQ